MTTIREAFAAGVRRVGFEPLEPPPGTPPLPPGVELWRSSFAVVLLWPAASDVDGFEHVDDAGVSVLVHVLAALENAPPYHRLDAYLVLLGLWTEDLELTRHRVERRTDVARRFTVSNLGDLQRLTFFPLPEPATRPCVGLFRGEVTLAPDFDAPIPDFDEYQ